MRSIWVRAGLGALAVFAIGMMIHTAVHTTKAKATGALLQLKTELDSGAVVAFDHLDREVPFILDGRKLGHLASLTFEPGAGAVVPSLSAVVALDREGLDAAMLSYCELVPVNPERFEQTQGFRCATPSDDGLRSIGEVRFEPVGVVRPVRADKAPARRWVQLIVIAVIALAVFALGLLLSRGRRSGRMAMYMTR